jgi:hypothetical protein
MEQTLSWKANQFLASQELWRILWNANVYYRIHQCPPFVPILSQLDSFHITTPQFLKTHLNTRIILPSTPGSPKWSFFPQVHTKNLYTPVLSSYALPVPPISFFSILSPEQYWVKNTDHSAPHYVVFSTPLSPRPSYALILYSTTYSQTP